MSRKSPGRGPGRPTRRPGAPPRSEAPRGRPGPRRPAAQREHGPARNIRLLIEYEGTRYAGWQVQKNSRTVAGEILEAIRSELGETPRLFGAGRTDHGVHAEGQVANFETRARLPSSTIADALNRSLPADIHILRAEDVGSAFHARHDALSRRYRYQIASRRSAFFKRLIWWVPRPLDLPSMQRAAALLPGRHDFSSFADRSEPIREPRVRVLAADVRRRDFLTSFRIEADHFLPRMVRRIVGVLVQIGAGEIPPEAMGRYLEKPVDDPARWTAPPSGLFLESVRYPAGPAPGGRGGPGSAPDPGSSGRRPDGSPVTE